MSDVIRKTSTTANGGKETKVVTYEDLLKDPQVMESMKQSLGLFFIYLLLSSYKGNSGHQTFISFCFRCTGKKCKK